MKKFLLGFIIFVFIIAGALYMGSRPVVCDDCNKGKQCNTSYDCGEIGVCYCQYSYEEEQDEGSRETRAKRKRKREDDNYYYTEKRRRTTDERKDDSAFVCPVYMSFFFFYFIFLCF